MDYSKKIRRRLQNLGVKYSDALVVSSWFQLQMESMGDERAIAYLKSVGDCILWYLYGTPLRPSWIRTRHRFPRGIYVLRKYPEATLLRVAKFARSVVLDDLTVSQVTKVVEGALAPYKGSDKGIQQVTYLIQVGCSSVSFRGKHPQPVKPTSVCRQFRRVQSVSGPTPVTHSPPIKESLEILSSIECLSALPYFDEVFFPLNRKTLEVEPSWNGFIGEIHAAQEGGGKLRMYAAPYTGIQCLLSPIHDWIDNFRRQVGTDCTYDQLSGAHWAQEHLILGHTVHSVDLSTATCRFPLAPQLEMLRGLGLGEEYITALTFACKGTWKVGEELVGLFPATLTWSVGQPLGIKPSMSMFSLAHNMLLWGLCLTLRIDPLESFRVLGDDVVMVGDDLHSLYRVAMSNMGVPISEHKSHSSSAYAEFAGASISRTSVVRPGRWRTADVNSHIGIALDLGTPLVGEVSKPWLSAEKLWLFINEKYNPPISEWSRYLRASTMVSKELLALRTELTARNFETGLSLEVQREFKHWPKLLENRSIAPEKHIFSVLPDNDVKDRWYWIVSDFQDIDWGADHAYLHAIWCIEDMMINSLISALDAVALIAKVEAKLMELYWLPPADNYLRDGKLTKKLLKALAF